VAYVVNQVQPTPNPNAMKFVLDTTISSIPLRFYSPDQAKDHPLAAGLMAIEGVSNVMLLADFVTIGKRPEAKWSEIKPRVTRLLKDAEPV
jgi:hypothetical protein